MAAAGEASSQIILGITISAVVPTAVVGFLAAARASDVGGRLIISFCLLLLFAEYSRPQAQMVSKNEPEMQVSQIGSETLAKYMRGPGKIILIDVRTLKEFSVSHIKGATRIEPSIEYGSLIARLRHRASKARIVFYCTTSGRSADLALGVYDNVMTLGADGVYVLKGGIVAWHNEGRPLVNAKGATQYVHPYSREVLLHLKRPALARGMD